MNTSLVNDISKTKVITDSTAWRYYLKEAINYDFYHTSCYHKLDRQGVPVMFVYEENGIFLALPLIKRKIEQTPYFDCTTVYGYTGVLCNADLSKLSETFTRSFIENLQEYFSREQIISWFCILHPLFEQNGFFTSIGRGALQVIGKTVAVNLRTSLEEQRSLYRRPIRMKINQLKKKGYDVRLARTEKELREFVEIYYENMGKVGASERYYFDEHYFQQFMKSTEFQPELLLAYYDNKIAAGAMVGLSKDIIQLHLAGTRNEFLRESPMKLIFDEASLLGRARDMRFLHLGSGIGGREDSLFHFKLGFSDITYDFTTWHYIADELLYNELVNEKIKAGVPLNPSYFPLYRSC